MKKYIFLFLTVMIFVGVSCTDDYENPVTAGVSIQLHPTYCYPLDQGVVGKAYVTADYVSQIESDELGTVAIANGEGEFVFTKEDLGFENAGDALTTYFGAYNQDDKICRTEFTFSFEDPLAVSGAPNVPPGEQDVSILYQLADDCTAPTSLIITESVDGGDPVEILNETYTDYDFAEKELVKHVTDEDAGKSFTYKWTFANEYGTVSSEFTFEVKIKTSYDFESGTAFTVDTYTDWTFEDGDGLGTYTFSACDFENAGYTGAFILFNTTLTDPPVNEEAAWAPHSGDSYMLCADAVPGADGGNNDFMISQGYDIEAGYTVEFYAKSITDSYGLERFIVWARNNDTKEDIQLTDGDYIEAPLDWTKFEYDLAAFEGQNISIMINCVSYDAFALLVDDFMLNTGEKDTRIFNNPATGTSNLDFGKF